MFFGKLRARIELLITNLEIIRASYFRQYDVITKAYVLLQDGRIHKAKELLLKEMIDSSQPEWWDETEVKK